MCKIYIWSLPANLDCYINLFFVYLKFIEFKLKLKAYRAFMFSNQFSSFIFNGQVVQDRDFLTKNFEFDSWY